MRVQSEQNISVSYTKRNVDCYEYNIHFVILQNISKKTFQTICFVRWSNSHSGNKTDQYLEQRYLDILPTLYKVCWVQA